MDVSLNYPLNYLTAKTDDEAKVQIIGSIAKIYLVTFQELLQIIEKLKNMTFDKTKEYEFCGEYFRFLYDKE